jgi:GH25 family lysozyme M1 (1,4-beta-N-acetylmuramidase)
MSERTLVFDISHYQKDIDFDLLKANGIECVIVKATQGRLITDATFHQYAREAADAGMVVGAYHWCDPIDHDQLQAQHCIDTISGTPVQFIAIDIEQFWQDWEEWLRWRRRLIPTITNRFTPARISQNAHAVAAILEATLDMPLLIYTRLSFISQHAPPIFNWISNHNLWLAQWPFHAGRQEISWEAFKTDILPTVPTQGLPKLPEGSQTWHFWQFTGDRFVLPGVNGKLDINFFNGSIEQLRNFAADRPVIVDPEPQDPVVVDADVEEDDGPPYPGMTNQDMINVIFRAAFPFTNDPWNDWIVRAKMSFLADPHENRKKPYPGPRVENIPNLSAEEKSAILAELRL